MSNHKRDTAPKKDKLVSSVLELHKQKHKAQSNGGKPGTGQLYMGLRKFRGLLGRQLKEKIKESEASNNTPTQKKAKP